MRVREQVHRLAAVFRRERGIEPNARPRHEIRMPAAFRRAIEIVRGAKRVQVRRVDFHRGLGDLNLESRGLGLLREIRVRDAARRGFREHVIERSACHTELRADQNQNRDGHERDAIRDLVEVLGPVFPLESGRIRQEPVLRDEHVGMSDKPKFVTCPRSSAMRMPQAAHCACRQPEAQGQRPVTRQPPSTCVAEPFGASEPATQVSGPSPHTSRCARSGNSAASHAQTFNRLATQAVEPQPRPSSAMTAMYVWMLV